MRCGTAQVAEMMTDTFARKIHTSCLLGHRGAIAIAFVEWSTYFTTFETKDTGLMQL